MSSPTTAAKRARRRKRRRRPIRNGPAPAARAARTAITIWKPSSPPRSRSPRISPSRWRLAISDPAGRMIGQYLIDMVDEAGYLIGDLDAVADKLGAPRAEVEAVLAILQTLDPPGVCARNLTECLALQLKDRDRYDPAMRTLVEHLDILAKRDLAALAPAVRRQRRRSRRHDCGNSQSQSQARPRFRLDHGAADRARRVCAARRRTAPGRSSSIPTRCRKC